MDDKTETHIISKLFDNFKNITPLLVTIGLGTGLIIFLPESILIKMKLNIIPDTWITVISLLFIFSISVTVVIFAYKISQNLYEKYLNKKIIKILEKKLPTLSREQKAFIKYLLHSESKNIDLDATSGNIMNLEENFYITKAMQMGQMTKDGGCLFRYVPTTWLLELYNKNPKSIEKYL